MSQSNTCHWCGSHSSDLGSHLRDTGDMHRDVAQLFGYCMVLFDKRQGRNTKDEDVPATPPES